VAEERGSDKKKANTISLNVHHLYSLFKKKKYLVFSFSPSAKLKSQTVYMDTTTEPYSTARQITLHLLDSAAAHIALLDAHMCEDEISA
jgi:hypothetical protein